MARVWEQREVSEARQQATTALMDAAERLLFEFGYAGVTTRRVAEEAGVKHGLVHYYFGSMEELLTQTLERVAERLAHALEVRRPRTATRPTKASKRRRVDAKKRRGETKRSRRRPDLD
jgi:AcrR family transcriptional regulator